MVSAITPSQAIQAGKDAEQLAVLITLLQDPSKVKELVGITESLEQLQAAKDDAQKLVDQANQVTKDNEAEALRLKGVNDNLIERFNKVSQDEQTARDGITDLNNKLKDAGDAKDQADEAIKDAEERERVAEDKIRQAGEDSQAAIDAKKAADDMYTTYKNKLAALNAAG